MKLEAMEALTQQGHSLWERLLFVVDFGFVKVSLTFSHLISLSYQLDGI